MNLTDITDALVRDVGRLQFDAPVTHVYNPLEYARASYDRYIERFGRTTPRDLILLGMNPGPWGMAQTGIPFGEVNFVRNWLGIHEPVNKPPAEHPKRPVLGFACRRSEVSGARFWGWAKDRFGTPAQMFRKLFIANYCPLVFMEVSGRNRTPNKLPAAERQPLFTACDRALCRTVEYFQPKFVIGIGAFAESRARALLSGFNVRIGRVLHPSPANPSANRGWGETMSEQLRSIDGLSQWPELGA